MLRSFLALALTVAAAASGAQAATTIRVKDAGQGWINQDQYASPPNDGVAVSNNVLVGNCGYDCPYLEFRNFFYFKVPALSGPVTGAKLVLDTGDVQTGQGSPIGYQVTRLSAAASARTFDNLGTGTLYGSRDYTATDYFKSRPIALDAAALSVIGSGGKTFALGGRITNEIGYGSAERGEYVFGYATTPAKLVLTVGGAAVTAGAAPEPGTWALTMLGLGLAGAALRRARVSCPAR
jgi:hypothetical protein